MLESLESRRYFTIPVVGGVAAVGGGATNEVFELILSSGVLQLRNGAGTVIDSVVSAGVTGVSITGGGGNDFIRIGKADGTGIPGVNCTLRGGAGNDTIIGSKGVDKIFGDSENDKLDGRSGGDTLDGGTGFDTVDYSARSVAVNVTLNNSSPGDGSSSGDNSVPSQYNDNGADIIGDCEAVVGGSGPDKLVGSSVAQWFDGGGNNDSIYAGDGIDTIYGGSGSDLAYGEGGDDSFYVSEPGTPDRFLGSPGTTYAYYDAGIDTAAPTLTTPTPARALSLAGKTTLSASAPRPQPDDFVDVVLTAQDVQNQQYTWSEKKNSPPNPVPDYLVKRLQALKPDGTLEVNGTFLADIISLTQVDGIITVDVNGERYDADAASVTKVLIRGLEGDDSISTDGSLSVPVVFEGGDGNDSLAGGGTNDQLFGGNGNDFIWGRAGNDNIFGEAGDDVLIGESGEDVLDGGAGRDILFGGTEVDNLLGSAGDDILIGGFTSYDNDVPVLTALASEWSRTDLAYQNRVANINGSGPGGGRNQVFYLRPGTTEQGTKTVFDDGVTDILSGGADSDYFFAMLKDNPDTVVDLASGEKLTQL